MGPNHLWGSLWGFPYGSGEPDCLQLVRKRLAVERRKTKYSLEQIAWFNREVTDPHQIQMEAASTLAQMGEAIKLSPLEVLTISEASDQLAIERNWIADVNRIVKEREARHRQIVRLRAGSIRKVRERRIKESIKIVLLWLACIAFAVLGVTR